MLTETERKEIARQAVRARWAKAGKLKAALEEPQGPKPEPEPQPADDVPFSLLQGTLNFGGIALECHVLSDLRRVLSQGQVVKVLTGGTENRDLARYLRRNPLFEADSYAAPILFKLPNNPTLAKGMEGTTLIEICDLYIEAAEKGLLHHSQTGSGPRVCLSALARLNHSTPPVRAPSPMVSVASWPRVDPVIVEERYPDFWPVWLLPLGSPAVPFVIAVHDRVDKRPVCWDSN